MWRKSVFSTIFLMCPAWGHRNPSYNTGMRVLAVGNSKGGTGKTSAAVHIAAYLASKGKRTLLLDLDPQASASAWLLGFGVEDGASLATALQGGSAGPVREGVREGLDVMPGGARVGAVATVVNVDCVSRVLAASNAANYSNVVIDCPPSVGRLMASALLAADRVLVPCECSFLAMSGLAEFRHALDAAQGQNPRLKLLGVVPTRSTRTVHSRDAIRMMQDAYGKQVTVPIPEAVAVRDAASNRTTVFDLVPGSKVAEAYAAIGELVRVGK
jgi:chromosome partitioning protein